MIFAGIVTLLLEKYLIFSYISLQHNCMIIWNTFSVVTQLIDNIGLMDTFIYCLCFSTFIAKIKFSHIANYSCYQINIIWISYLGDEEVTQLQHIFWKTRHVFLLSNYVFLIVCSCISYFLSWNVCILNLDIPKSSKAINHRCLCRYKVFEPRHLYAHNILKNFPVDLVF